MRVASEPNWTDAPSHRNVRAVLARRGFRRLLAIRLSSQLGDGLFQAGLVGNVLFNPESATAPTAIAAAFAVLLVPYSILGPFVGVFLDRWSRRRVLFATTATRALLVVPTAVIVGTGGSGSILTLCALAVIALNRLFLAGLLAAQPRVVAEQRLVTANSLATTMGSAAYSSGLVVAATTFHLTGADPPGYGIVVATAAAWYGFSALLTAISFQVTTLGPNEAELSQQTITGALAANARDMVAGLHHLARRPPASSVVLVQALHRGFFGALSISTLLLYRHYYYAADPVGSMTGLMPVAAAVTAGALLSAAITPAIVRRYGGWPWIAVLMAALAVLVPGLGLPFHPWLTTTAAGVISVASLGIRIVTDTTIQWYCDDDFRGRVFSVNDTAMNLSYVAGVFLGAVTLPPDGRSASMLFALGGGYALLAGWFVLVSSRWTTSPPTRVSARTRHQP